MSGLGFLALVLQRSNSFDLSAFFSSFVWFIHYCLQGPYSIVVFRGRVFHGFVWSRLEVFFFVSNLQIVFPSKSLFSDFPSFFVLFVYNDGALKLHLHVVALPTSVTIERPTKTSQKFNIYRLDLPDRIF